MSVPEHEVDVVVVGSGAGGLTAAIAARSHGLEVLLIEKGEAIGGSSALSGGGVWVPNAPTFLRLGVRDDPDDVLAYMQACAGDVVGIDRLRAYVKQAPSMLAFLEAQSRYLFDAFTWTRGYSDYRPDLGGTDEGRSLWPRPIDRGLLGPDRGMIRRSVRGARLQLPFGAWMTADDLRDLITARWGGSRGKLLLAKLAYRAVKARLFGTQVATSGNSLIIRLWLACREQDVPLWRGSPMQELTTDGSGAITGVIVERDGQRVTVRARHGVVLATGGFEHDQAFRSAHQPHGRSDWSVGNPDNEGDGLHAASAVGAASAMLEEAWWIPTVAFPDGTLFPTVADRQHPGHFMVNQAGERYVNEAAPYSDFVHEQLKGHASGVSHIPTWMIFDDRAWKRNFFIGHFPGAPTPREWLDGKVLFRADTIQELAEQIDIPPKALSDTAERFNRFARDGRDEDFHRGDSAYDRVYGDPGLDNPCLAEVSKPPFYAIPFVPGDLGTNGGLLTDEHARVLREDGSPIHGLYATGNVTASVMGHGYAGAGATLGPAMTFGYIAALEIAREVQSGAEGEETVPVVAQAPLSHDSAA